MQFRTVAEAFQSIEKTSSRIAITKDLAELLQKANPQQASQICYLALGVLNPPHIGTQFNLAQKSMVKVVADLYGKTEEEIKTDIGKLGDLGNVVEQLAPKHKTTLTVCKVYDRLSEIEAIEGTGSQERKSEAVQALLKELDPICAKYATRVILGTLRLGFSAMTLVDALSWMETNDKSLSDDIENSYNVCADVGLIAQALKTGGIEAIRKMKMRVGVPVRPAAADRLPDAKTIVEKLGNCVAQPKFDGFRLQIHVDKTGKTPVIRFFSRNLTDMSGMFPELVAACEKLPVKTLIADGEAMAYDPNTKLFAAFQETVKRKRKHHIEEAATEYPLQLHIFDILQLDGKVLIDESHTERRATLEKLLKKVDDETLKIIDEKKITTAQELESYFIQEIAAGLEGLVVKKPHAIYRPGKRSANWIKLKYQASEKLQDTLDVVILGYYPGRGKRSKFGIGAFLVGIYNPRDHMYETVAKVGTGLTDEQWVELKKRCDALKVKSQPNNVLCDKNLAPLVWVTPSIVCEVLADEVTLSPVHTAGKTKTKLGYALRFPRFMNYRDDKDSHQATTVAELATLSKR